MGGKTFPGIRIARSQFTDIEQANAIWQQAHRNARRRGEAEIRIFGRNENPLNAEASGISAKNAPPGYVSRALQNLKLWVTTSEHRGARIPHTEIRQRSPTVQREAQIRETNSGRKHGESLPVTRPTQYYRLRH
jgi:hypothetical protein